MATAALLGLLLVPVSAGTATADGPLPLVSAAPTTGVVDGQPVAINIRSVPGAEVVQARARLCRPGVIYLPISGDSPARDFEGGPNCPSQVPISTSADIATVDSSPRENFKDPGGDTFVFRVGSGVASWQDSQTRQDQTLSCDSDHPCSLVVEVDYLTSPTSATWQPFVFGITYAKDDPFGGCGRAAPGVIQSGGSDRMVDAWVRWTGAECARPGRSGAATRATFVGEGKAVTCFSSGDLDLAYTAGGYDPAMGLVQPPTADPNEDCHGRGRSAVAVPIAVDAAEMAVAGGRRVSGHNLPFRTMKLTTDEVAAMLTGGGNDGATLNPHLPDIRNRNPELAGFLSTGSTFGADLPAIGAYAGAEASSWYGTRWIKNLAPGAWKVPASDFFGPDRGRDRGIDVSLALADPTFAKSIGLVSGRPPLRRTVFNAGFDGNGVWVLTDSVTAAALSMTPVQITNARGDFVAPTAESLLAGVKAMKADDLGILISDPKATAPPGEVQPYPMTMVEYALAPAEALVDATCAPRADSQALLKGWLSYLVGDGQANLPAGMVPLPPDLLASARKAINKVGATPMAAKDCPASPGDPHPDSSAGPASKGGDGSGAAGGTTGGSSSSARNGGSGAGLSSGGGTASSPGATPGSTPAGSPSSGSLVSAFPPFLGRRVAGWLRAVVSLLGLAGSMSCAAWFTVRRLNPPDRPPPP